LPDKPRTIELNEPSRRAGEDALREHLISAANEIYLFEHRSLLIDRPVPEAVKRAHSAIRAELKRLNADRERREG
jgi:hypothetical protein